MMQMPPALVVHRLADRDWDFVRLLQQLFDGEVMQIGVVLRDKGSHLAVLAWYVVAILFIPVS
jgi:hypothetical protein